MKAIQLDHTHRDLKTAIDSLKIVEKPIPEPRPGQVLVKIEAAPCNPADFNFLQGTYGVKKTLPTVPGWEGAGTVVKNGGGIIGWWLQGKRVACGRQAEGDGTWAEYFIADAKSCIPLRSDLEIEQGATLIVNPLTAVGLVQQAEKEGRKAIIQTAACSQVGRLVQKLTKWKGIPLINIVRRSDQVELLTSIGEKYALNSSDEQFYKLLKTLAHEMNATIAFDAVAGDLTGSILEAMPRQSKAVVYGGLSLQRCGKISPLDLIFQEKVVEGFWLTKWLQSHHFWEIFRETNFIQQCMVQGKFKTGISQVVGFDEWKSALNSYLEKMTAGKVILKP